MPEAAVQKRSEEDHGKGLDAVSAGKVLKQARERAELTRPEVEQRTGISRARLYRLERGLFTMKLDEMYALCSTYNLPHSAVMAGYAEEVRGPDDDQGERDPTAEARDHLQQAATLLGLRLVPEREGAEAAGPGIKVDPGEAVSLEALLDNLAKTTAGQPNQVDTKTLAQRIDDALAAAQASEVTGLVDAGDHRGIDVRAFEDAVQAVENDRDDVEPDGIRGLEREALHQTLARLVVVQAVYGVDPFALSLNRVKQVNEALSEAFSDDVDLLDEGPVTSGRRLTELLDSDDQVRNRMARDLLPYLLDAAKAGQAPVAEIKATGTKRKG